MGSCSVLVTVPERPQGETRSVPIAPGETISFGRGGGFAVDLELDYPGLSRRAGFLGVFSDHRISITSYQTGGAIEVRRANGVTANRLSMGEACVVAPGRYTVEVVGTSGPPVKLELWPDDSAGAESLRAWVPVTEPAISARGVLTPGPGQEWQTVLALACLLARREARSDGWAAPSAKQLASIVGAWFSVIPSDKWLSDRLDAALNHLHLPRDGSDKLPRLVARALAGGLLSDELLDQVENQLTLRLTGPPRSS